MDEIERAALKNFLEFFVYIVALQSSKNRKFATTKNHESVDVIVDIYADVDFDIDVHINVDVNFDFAFASRGSTCGGIDALMCPRVHASTCGHVDASIDVSMRRCIDALKGWVKFDGDVDVSIDVDVVFDVDVDIDVDVHVDVDVDVHVDVVSFLFRHTAPN